MDKSFSTVTVAHMQHSGHAGADILNGPIAAIPYMPTPLLVPYSLLLKRADGFGAERLL